MTGSKIRRLMLGLFCTLLLSPVALAGTAVASTTGHPSRHHHRQHHHAGIPQHNGGDHDSDNNGAPSDGDGNR